jgi:hypothetical protein
MPRFGPVKRAELVRYLCEVGFEPYSGGRRQFRVRGEITL